MSSVQYEIEEYKQDIMFLLFNPCFIIIFNPYNNMSLWLHHIGSLGNPCYQCSRACKGSRRRSRSCSHLSRTHWMDLLSGIVFPPLHCFKCLNQNMVLTSPGAKQQAQPSVGVQAWLSIPAHIVRARIEKSNARDRFLIFSVNLLKVYTNYILGLCCRSTIQWKQTTQKDPDN